MKPKIVGIYVLMCLLIFSVGCNKSSPDDEADVKNETALVDEEVVSEETVESEEIPLTVSDEEFDNFVDGLVAAEMAEQQEPVQGETLDPFEEMMLQEMQRSSFQEGQDPNSSEEPGGRRGEFGGRSRGEFGGGFRRGDPNSPPGRPDFGGRGGRGGREDRGDAQLDPTDPNALMAINLNGIEMGKIIPTIVEITGLSVMIAGEDVDEIMKKKLVILVPDKLTNKDGLLLIYAALEVQAGMTHREFIASSGLKTIILEPMADAKFGRVPIVAPEEALQEIEDKSIIVQKFFALKAYTASEMVKILEPLVDKEYGLVAADDATNKISVIDTVGNLIRLEEVIKQFDTSEVGQVEVKIFKIEFGDPVEITNKLNQILSGESTVGTRVSTGSRSYGRDGYRGPSRSSSSQSSGDATKTISIGIGKVPIVLIPDVKRSEIIAKASAEGIIEISKWIENFDVERGDADSQWESIPLLHENAVQVEDSISDIIQEMPEELRQNIFTEPFEKSNQIMVFGSKENREIIKQLIKEADVPAPVLPRKTFKLEHRDVEEIAEKIEELFAVSSSSSSSSRYSSYGGYRGYGGGSSSSSEEIQVVYDTTLSEITVIASQLKLDQIEKQIAAWDQPLDITAFKPLIVTLENSDPIQIVNLLNSLLASEGAASSNQRNLINMIFGGSSQDEREKIIGPLYGKLAFEAVPDTKKILVLSKIPSGYAAAEQIIRDLDKAEPAEIPRQVQVKYADCEELSERLNALFNQDGTLAPIRRSEQGLEYTIQVEDETVGSGQQTATSAEYTSPWSRGARAGAANEMPISNLIGRVRFVPDPRTKSIMVLAPQEYIEDIVKMIEGLDQPAKQVMIVATVVEVDKSKWDSIGVQFASDPSVLGASNENSLYPFGEFTQTNSHGSRAFGKLGTSGYVLDAIVGLDVNVAIDLLVKKTDAKILSKQSLFIQDKRNGEFFFGSEIAFLGATNITGTAATVTQGLDYREVGMALRVRPNITPERNVDMIIDLSLSKKSQSSNNNQPDLAKARTNNSLIVKDGHTVLLSRMFSLEDTEIERKVPLLGDLPILGGLFRHNSLLKTNRELLVFITPHVIDDEDVSEKVIPEVEKSIIKMEEVRKQLEEQWMEIDAE